MARVQHDKHTVAFKHRNALEHMTMLSHKTVKAEDTGYLSAILYLMPHTSGGGKTLCPHSTPACRQMCLANAGFSALPRQLAAKQRRTEMFELHQAAYIAMLAVDIGRLVRIADREGRQPAVRLNGTSDILWERLPPMTRPGDRQGPANLMEVWPEVQFYDYTKIPLEHRGSLPENYHLTFSVAGLQDMGRAVEYLRAGQSVSVVVPGRVKDQLSGMEIDIGSVAAPFVDGDEHDLRFLAAPGSIVLLAPKGHVVTDLMRPDILNELRAAVRQAAA